MQATPWPASMIAYCRSIKRERRKAGHGTSPITGLLAVRLANQPFLPFRHGWPARTFWCKAALLGSTLSCGGFHR